MEPVKSKRVAKLAKFLNYGTLTQHLHQSQLKDATIQMMFKDDLQEILDKVAFSDDFSAFVKELKEGEDNSGDVDELSLDSDDQHPNAAHFYYLLSGGGQREWRNDDQIIEHMDNDGNSITKIIKEYRKQCINGAIRLMNLSNQRILTLSFIYIYSNNNLDCSFNESCKEHHNIIGKLVKWMKLDNVSDDAMIWCSRLFCSLTCNDKQHIDGTICKIHQAVH